jgi:Ni,Fe-hydrogenase III large subunit
MARLTVPEYLRRAAMGRRINHAADLTAEALRELSRIGSNLNQLSRLAHSGQYNSGMIDTAAQEVRNAALRLAGSEPEK